MATKKSVRNSRMLLAAYWGCKVIGGANPLKAALNVLLMEKHSADKERQRNTSGKRERSSGRQAGASGALAETKQKDAAGTKAAAAAAAGKKAPKASAGSRVRKAAKVSAAAAAVMHNKKVRKVLKSALKSARVY